MAELTDNLGLYTWDVLATDTFDAGQLADNWETLDDHDHSPGKGLQLGSNSILPLAIGTPQLALNAVTAAQIANGAVGTAQIANGAVTSSLIATNAVGSAQIANGAVGTSELATGAVTQVDIATGAVGTAQIANGAVGTTQLATNSVTSAQLAANSVGTTQIATGAVGSSQVANGAIGTLEIALASILPANLDPSVIPVGQIMMWYSPNAGAVPGGFWEIMDGRAWSTITNTIGPGGTQLNVGNIPDMRNAFPMGAAVNGSGGPTIGSTGGSSTISTGHIHNVLGHAHAIADHNHNIEAAGSHNHSYQGGLQMHSRTNGFLPGITLQDTSGNQRQDTLQTLYLAGWNDGGGVVDDPFVMDAAGNHVHISDGIGGQNTNSVTTTTDSQGGGTSIIPPHVAVLFAMRVR